MSSIKLSITFSQVNDPSNLHEVCQEAAKHYADSITNFCGIANNTEYQLDNFGLSSAWLCESPFKLSFEYTEDDVTVVISDY
jgi:hypothetical protein